MKATSKFGNVLVAVDGSDQSMRAVDVGISLATKYDSVLTALYVVHIPFGESLYPRCSHSVGVDARNSKVADMSKLDVVEPLAVKEQIIKSATEAASMILRVDDVIASSKSGGAPAMPPGGGGMGGMDM